MDEIVIVAAKRTVQGRFLGALKERSAADLGVAAGSAALAQLPPEATAIIDQAIIGNVLGAGLGMNVARQIALRCGLPERVPAYTVNMMCASGMQAVMLAAIAIRAGEARAILCGGTESMSNAPQLLQRVPEVRRIGADGRADALQHDGLIDPLLGEHMGVTAERLAQRYRLDRGMQDALAQESHQRYAEAQRAGRFMAELVTLPGLDHDEHPRPGLTREQLGSLKPAFAAAGTITAGNASGINDGAALLVVASAAIAQRHGWPVMARLVAWTSVGCDPATMGLGPVHALKELTGRFGVDPDACDHIELNEAFAAQALACIGELGLPRDRVNPDGGAIALGHPIGASGARLLVHLACRTASGASRRSLASLCVGGGMGHAMALSA
jgi:acetyl-CoA C-acetyltransferase